MRRTGVLRRHPAMRGILFAAKAVRERVARPRGRPPQAEKVENFHLFDGKTRDKAAAFFGLSGREVLRAGLPRTPPGAQAGRPPRRVADRVVDSVFRGVVRQGHHKPCPLVPFDAGSHAPDFLVVRHEPEAGSVLVTMQTGGSKRPAPRIMR